MIFFDRNAFDKVCRPNSGAAAFFTSVLVWGIGVGCFSAVYNNFLVEIHDVTGTQRGLVVFFSEIPGVSLVALFALLARFSDWQILKMGALISLLAVLLLTLPMGLPPTIAVITIWALGEHLVMPVRQSLALSLAREGQSGESLGIVTGATNFGTVAGALAAAAVFFICAHCFNVSGGRFPYDIVFVLAALLLGISFLIAQLVKDPPSQKTRRPSFYFRRKYWRFYVLELFYGARKQVFITFGPFVLIKLYGLNTSQVALLFSLSAFLSAIFGARLIGKLTDRFGYRNIMIYDTVILFFVCLLYGYARDIFPMTVALPVVCVNYVLDTMISHASIATNLYARTLSESQEELTATLSSGISVNHVITIVLALIGGMVFDKWGAGVLFSFSALMAILNSAFALTIPKERKA